MGNNKKKKQNKKGQGKARNNSESDCQNTEGTPFAKKYWRE